VDVARAQFYRQAVAFAVEQQQRMVAGGLEVSVVGALFPRLAPLFDDQPEDGESPWPAALFLAAVNRDFGAVHVEHHPPP
jgi:hypothetical protein